MRYAEIERKTKETDVIVKLTLEGTGIIDVKTGIGFFDHMLTQIATHGLFDLNIKAKGDLFVDLHHTIEDCGLALGEAFSNALGDRQGITRIASMLVPMDDALGQIVIDFSGRPYVVLQTMWAEPMVGNIPTSLIEHFFESFSVSSRCTLHASILSGRNNHHMAEALFKAMGIALDVATSIDPRRSGKIPSSKGVL